MPPFPRKSFPNITIIGAGNLAKTLGLALKRAGYPISEIVTRNNPRSLRKAGSLARKVGARTASLETAVWAAGVVWICVPDDVIAVVVRQLARRADWKGRVVLHSSGALGSDVLKALRDRGARTASAHPLMTFVKLSRSDLKNVPFALEGENKALSVVGAIVRSLGARPFRMPLRLKPAYHAFGFFSSPAIVALMVAAQRVGKLAGLSQNRGRELMSPIVRETIENCLRTDPRAAFSGPMRRGDVATVRKHLAVLKQDPALLQVYRALGGIALEELPVANSGELRKILTTGPPYRLR